jgi:NodT family efflux transporter outer membrane factor (OMF) lipoprotein
LKFRVFLLVACACNVGPAFHPPSVAINQGWSEHGDPRLAQNATVDILWWRTFDDPALDRLIEIAYHQNLSLQLAGLRIFEARAQLGVAIGDQFPTNPGPIASAQAVRLSNSAPNTAMFDRSYRQYQIGFDATWEIDFWGKYRQGVRAAHASYLATVADYDSALVALTAEVARTYVTIRMFEELIDLARQNEQYQQEGLDIAQARYRNGATSELDVAQASNLLETTRASIPTLQMGLQQAHNALSTLLGQPTGYIQPLLGEQHGIPAPPPYVAVSVPAEMLRRRADIRAAELRAIAQCDRIGIAKSELYPKFVLFGAIGTQSSNVGARGDSAFENLFGTGSLIYTAAASVFWPILSYPRIINNVRVEDARFQQTLVVYVNTVLVAMQEVEDGMAGYLREQDSAVFAQNAVGAAENAVQLALIQYREGSVDYTRVLDSQRELLQSQNLLTNTRASVATNLIALYKALGGGWEIHAGEPVIPEGMQREMQQRTNWGGYFTQPR